MPKPARVLRAMFCVKFPNPLGLEWLNVMVSSASGLVGLKYGSAGLEKRLLRMSPNGDLSHVHVKIPFAAAPVPAELGQVAVGCPE